MSSRAYRWIVGILASMFALWLLGLGYSLIFAVILYWWWMFTTLNDLPSKRVGMLIVVTTLLACLCIALIADKFGIVIDIPDVDAPH